MCPEKSAAAPRLPSHESHPASNKSNNAARGNPKHLLFTKVASEWGNSDKLAASKQHGFSIVASYSFVLLRGFTTAEVRRLFKYHEDLGQANSFSVQDLIVGCAELRLYDPHVVGASCLLGLFFSHGRFSFPTVFSDVGRGEMVRCKQDSNNETTTRLGGTLWHSGALSALDWQRAE